MDNSQNVDLYFEVPLGSFYFCYFLFLLISIVLTVLYCILTPTGLDVRSLCNTLAEIASLYKVKKYIFLLLQ